MMSKKEIISKSLTKAIITILVTIIGILSINNVSLAYGTWQGDENGGMPQNPEGNRLSITGLLPQILKQRQFTGDADTEFPYEEWKTDISTGTVYCANSGTAVRFGKIDPKPHYIDEVPGYGDGFWSYSTFERMMKECLDKYAKEDYNNLSGTVRNFSIDKSSYNISYKQFDGPGDYPERYPIDTSAALIPYKMAGDPNWHERFLYAMNNLGPRLIASILDQLGEWDKPVDNEDESVNPDPGDKRPDWDGTDTEFGPEVCVMETTEGAENGYKKVGSTQTATNDRLAYILSAMENSYTGATGTLHDKYSLSDIQTAHWKEVDHDGIVSYLTPNGLKLFDQAIKYQEFVDNYLNNYKDNLTIDDTNAQVIVNQETKKYIVGPFTVSYPDYDDISYVKAIYLKTDEGTGNEKTLIYDESHDDFEILYKGGTKTGSNGLAKEYPATDEQFYIKFSAEDTNYPTEVKIYSDFEYLKESTIKYNNLETRANVYQYFGYTTYHSGDHATRRAWGVGSVRYTYELRHCRTGGSVSDGTYYHTHYWTDESNTINIKSTQGVLILQPFVQMSKYPVRNIRAQPLRVAMDGSRTYGLETVEGESGGIDLTFELGGKVWVDGTAGKENSFDGLFNEGTDTPMSNVNVTLYKVDDLDGDLPGEYVDEMKTDENGEYLFEEQNAMFQYYVKFTYNGQYYQPTIYNVDRDDSNWENTSKGLDILDERDAFNAQFEEIGPAPENVLGVEMHTREELEASGEIDEFGNPTGSDPYVAYSMMDSYTCNGTSTKDLYPGFKVFVNDDYLDPASNAPDVFGFVESNEIELLYEDPDVMHYINQGYVLRELVDLALRKDVYKAVLEINGKTQTYKYNKREPLYEGPNGESYWDLKTRISDGYYDDYKYSRELYREDFDYKIDDYRMDGTSTSLDNLELTQDSELKIYVTYKFTIRNRSEAIATNVTEVVDYYDQEFTYVPGRSFLGDSRGNKIGDIKGSDRSIYGSGTETHIPGYKNLYITGAHGGDFPLSDPDDPSKDVYFYLTFIVNKDSDRNNILDEQVQSGEPIGVGKENIAEINGYKSYYGQKAHAPNEGNPQTEEEYETGDIAGIPDTNSTPGNLDPADVHKDGRVNYDNFENDTDKAPNIRIILNRDQVRTVEGTVWEDIRNLNEQLASVGNGLRDDETGVNGVRVQLVELRDGKDGNKYEYIWKEVYSGNTDSIAPIINRSGIIPNYTIDTNNANGKYKFTSFAPGNYIVRFIYGSGESSVLGTTSVNYNTGAEQPNPVTNLYAANGYNKRAGDNGYSANSENIGLNKNSYNGHDYKSTSYQVGINNGTGAYENNSTASYTYDFAAADGGLYSDAKDIMNKKSDNVINLAPERGYLEYCANSRKQVEEYSNGDEINSKAEILSSFENIPEYMYTQYSMSDMDNLLKEFMRNTFMISESGTIDVNFEYNRTGEEDGYTNTSDSGDQNIGSSNYDKSGYYILKDLDLGLEQRPKAQLKVTKQITNVKVTLADNRVLFDASDKATNVLWIGHTAHGKDTKNTYSTNDNYESTNIMKNPVVRQQSTNKGKVQLTMDEELMHGSTIQITYAITVANVGEVDYKEDKFYYTGKVGDTNTIVKTDPRALVDYVGTQVHDYTSNDDKTATRNNLQFNAAQNPDWSVISGDDLLNRGLLNGKLAENVKKYSDGHIIVTDRISKGLIPIIKDQSNVKDDIKNAFDKDPLHALEKVNASQSVSGVQLILSQMLTQDSSSDDRIYNNMTELITTKNDVGRRMSYSVVGNQDPTIEPREIDADDSQEVVILPPFGQKYIYYVLGTAVAVILIAGIIITMIVLKKKK